MIAAVVLNWNRRDDTLACLASLEGQAGPDAVDRRVILVDNGSSDGTVDAVRAAFPAVEVITLPENRGYAAGVNVGIRHALAGGADWTLLVNNDTDAEPDTLGRLLAAAQDPTAGLITPTIYYYDDPSVVWPSAGWRRKLTLAAFDTTARPPSRHPYDVEWTTGCWLLVRRAVWESVGLFDERFGVYFEDHDLCLRVRAAGWRILHVPGATARHRVAQSTGTGTPQQMYLLGRSSVKYYLKHTHGAHRALIAAYRLASLARTLATTVAQGRPASGWAYVRGLGAGVRDVWQARRTGDGRSGADRRPVQSPTA